MPVLLWRGRHNVRIPEFTGGCQYTAAGPLCSLSSRICYTITASDASICSGAVAAVWLCCRLCPRRIWEALARAESTGRLCQPTIAPEWLLRLAAHNFECKETSWL